MSHLFFRRLSALCVLFLSLQFLPAIAVAAATAPEFSGIATVQYTGSTSNSNSSSVHVTFPTTCDNPQVVTQTYVGAGQCSVGTCPNTPNSTSTDIRSSVANVTPQGFDVFASADDGIVAQSIRIGWHAICGANHIVRPADQRLVSGVAIVGYDGSHQTRSNIAHVSLPAACGTPSIIAEPHTDSVPCTLFNGGCYNNAGTTSTDLYPQLSSITNTGFGVSVTSDDIVPPGAGGSIRMSYQVMCQNPVQVASKVAFGGVTNVTYGNSGAHSTIAHVTFPQTCRNPTVIAQSYRDGFPCVLFGGACNNNRGTTNTDIYAYAINVTQTGFDTFLSSDDVVAGGGQSVPIGYHVTCDADAPAPTGGADIALTLELEQQINAGSNMAEKMTVQNNGSTTVPSATLTQVLPAGLTMHPTLSNPACTSNGVTVTCPVPTLAPGASTVIWVYLTVPQTQTCGSTINKSATVSFTSATDVNPNNNTSSDSILVTCPSTPPPTAPQCSDGADNDGDNLVDFPQDPGCTGTQDNDETNAVSCQNPITSLLNMPGLVQFDVYEQSSGPAAVPTAKYSYAKNDVRLVQDIAQGPGVADLDTGASLGEKYDFYISNAAGQLDPNGDYFTVEAWTPGSVSNVGNNIDAIELVFSNGIKVPASVVSSMSINVGGNSASANEGLGFHNGVGMSGITFGGNGYSRFTFGGYPPVCGVAQCQDGVDNDNDGVADFPADFSCSSATDNDETLPRAQCQDGADNDGDGLADAQDPGCVSNQDNDEMNAAAQCPAPTFEYSMTTASTFFYNANGQASSSLTTCKNTPPPGTGWTLADSECLVSQNASTCVAESCLWKRSSQQSFDYILTHAGGNYPDSLSCANSAPAGYGLNARGCVAKNSIAPYNCFSDVCLWQKSAAITKTLQLSHAGGNATDTVSCRTQMPVAGHAFNSQICLLSNTGNCFSDLCLWEKASLCPAALQCSDGIDNADAEDPLADNADPGCHTDGNAANAASYNPQDNDETNTPPPSGTTGCIRIQKQALNSVGAPITPVPAFTFILDGNASLNAVSDANGVAVIDNVAAPGTHTITETPLSGWTQVTVSPTGGQVMVQPGSNCATMTFTNQQSGGPPPTIPQCIDGVDNDNDGATDFPADLSCSSATDNDETLPRAQCQDGFDNDADGLVDSQDPGCVNAQDNDESNVQTSSANLIATLDLSPQINSGDNLPELMGVLNAGSTTVAGATITQVIPAGLTFHAALSNGACSSNGAIVTCAVPTLAPGQSKTFLVFLTIPGNYTCGATINKSATVTAPSVIDGNPSDNIASDSTVVTCPVTPPSSSSSSPSGALGCIRIVKETFTSAGAPISSVTQFTFLLDGNPQQTTFNDSSGTALFQNVTPGSHVVTELMPQGWRQASVTPTDGTIFVFSGPQCSTVNFKNQQLSLSGSSSSSSTSSSTSSASSSSSSSPAPPAGPSANLAVTIELDPQINRTDMLPTKITVTNAGSTTVTNSTITQELPAGLNFNAGLSNSACTAAGSTVTCSVITLAPGESKVYLLYSAILPSQACGSTITEQATISTTVATDTNSADNSASDSILVTCP